MYDLLQLFTIQFKLVQLRVYFYFLNNNYILKPKQIRKCKLCVILQNVLSGLNT